MIRWPLQVRVPNRTVDQIVDVSISQPRRNLEVFSVVSDALISPEKWTAPLAQTLGEIKIVNIKPLRWSLCDRAGCTYCLKSLIGKWQNCTLMHSVRSFHLCDNSGLLGEVSPLRGSPGTKISELRGHQMARKLRSGGFTPHKIRAELSSNCSQLKLRTAGLTPHFPRYYKTPSQFDFAAVLQPPLCFPVIFLVIGSLSPFCLVLDVLPWQYWAY